VTLLEKSADVAPIKQALRGWIEQLPLLDEIDRALTTWTEEHRWLLSSDTAKLLQAAGVENSKKQEMRGSVGRRSTYHKKEAEKVREFVKRNRKWLAGRDRT